jgi:hypothetical protein
LNQPIAKSSLTDRQQLLVDLIQEHPFCRIAGLQVRGGEPSYNPQPQIIQKLKMGADNSRRPEADLPDFWLKAQIVDLLNTIAELGDGEIRSIEVQHGLPLLVEIERRPTVSGVGRG